MRKLFVVLCIVIPGVVYSLDAGKNGSKLTFTKHFSQSLFQVTAKEFFSVEMLLPASRLTVGINNADIIIHDSKDVDVIGAQVTVTVYQPQIGQGKQERPAVIEKRGGLYSVKDIVIETEGSWEIKVTVRRGDAVDSAAFVFPDVKKE